MPVILIVEDQLLILIILKYIKYIKINNFQANMSDQ